MAMQQIPVYAFTGFLDSGKTKFIQETLEDPRFNAGERTLVLIFEEGEEEYDLSTYPKKNVYLEVLDQQTVSTEELKALLAETPYPDRDALAALDDRFIAENLSPGGSADLLALTYLLHFITTEGNNDE